MKTFKPKLSVLPKEQRALWRKLAPIKNLGFTLYGGTAIALRLGHRTSVDFDFFTDRTIDKPALYKALPALRRGEVLQEGPDTLVVSVQANAMKTPVKLSFFAQVKFGRFGDPELTDDKVLRVASMKDLMATKVKVLFDRIEQRDYDDLAAMISAGADIATGIAIARQMFPELNPRIALQALTYHKDVPGLSMKARRILIKAATSVRDLPEVQRASHSLSGNEGRHGGARAAAGGRRPARARKPMGG
jgi:hypothetical protein